MVTAPARRELVRHLVDKGLSERRALALVRMSASAYRYTPRPDRNVELREEIKTLAACRTLIGRSANPSAWSIVPSNFDP